MSILASNLQSVTVSTIIRTETLRKIDINHFINQKLGNNPVDKFADDNTYKKCSFSNIEELTICGYGEENDRGLGATRDIDYASYITKIGIAIKDVPVVRTNGPFSSASNELMIFLNIWKKYYGSRTSHQRISKNDKLSNPFTVISAGITKNDRNLHLDMLIANTRLVETTFGEQKYFGDLIFLLKENLGYGSSYSNPNNYSESPEDRTTLNALVGKHSYGRKLMETVKESFAEMNFIIKDAQSIRPELSLIKHMLWVSNNYKQKTAK